MLSSFKRSRSQKGAPDEMYAHQIQHLCQLGEEEFDGLYQQIKKQDTMIQVRIKNNKKQRSFKVPSDVVRIAHAHRTKHVQDELLTQLAHCMAIQPNLLASLRTACADNALPYTLSNGREILITARLLTHLSELLSKGQFQVGISQDHRVPLSLFAGISYGHYWVESPAHQNYYYIKGTHEAEKMIFTGSKVAAMAFLERYTASLAHSIDAFPEHKHYVELLKLVERARQDIRDHKGRFPMSLNRFIGPTIHTPLLLLLPVSKASRSQSATYTPMRAAVLPSHFSRSQSLDAKPRVARPLPDTPRDLAANKKYIRFYVQGYHPIEASSSYRVNLVKSPSSRTFDRLKPSAPIDSKAGILEGTNLYGHSLCFPDRDPSEFMLHLKHELQATMQYTGTGHRQCYYVGQYSRNQIEHLQRAYGALVEPIMKSTSKHALFPVFPDILHIEVNAQAAQPIIPLDFTCFHTVKTPTDRHMYFKIPKGCSLAEALAELQGKVKDVRMYPVIIGQQPWALSSLKIGTPPPPTPRTRPRIRHFPAPGPDYVNVAPKTRPHQPSGVVMNQHATHYVLPRGNTSATHGSGRTRRLPS